MREKRILMIGMGVFFILCLTLFGVTWHIRNMEKEFRETYKSPSEVLQRQIDEIGSKEEIAAILSDSITTWREKDRQILADQLEQMQFYLDEYNDIKTMLPQKVDETYRRAINELVRKYRVDELKPTE